MCFLPLLWYCFFPYALLWLNKNMKLELSSHVGGEKTSVAAVFSAGLQFYVWLASANSVASCWSPSLHGRHLPSAETSMSKRVLVKTESSVSSAKLIYSYLSNCSANQDINLLVSNCYTQSSWQNEKYICFRNCLSNRKSILTPSACLNLQNCWILC